MKISPSAQPTAKPAPGTGTDHRPALFTTPTMTDDGSPPKKQRMAPENPRIIALFDVDGTLTVPRGEVTPDMMDFMKKLSEKITVGIVGGSDLPKQEEQLGEGIAKVFPYNFSQNGLVAYKDGELQEVQTISKFLGEDNIKRVVNWTMKYLADIDIPVKVSVSWSISHHIRLYFRLRKRTTTYPQLALAHRGVLSSNFAAG